MLPDRLDGWTIKLKARIAEKQVKTATIALLMITTVCFTAQRASAVDLPLVVFLDSLSKQYARGTPLQVDQLIALASKDTPNYGASLNLFVALYGQELKSLIEDSLRTLGGKALRDEGPRPDFDPIGIILARHFKIQIPVGTLPGTGTVTLTPPAATTTVPFPLNLLTVLGGTFGTAAAPTPININMSIRPIKLSVLAHGMFEMRRLELAEDIEAMHDVSKIRTAMDLFLPELSQLRVLYNVTPYIDCRLMMLVSLGALSYDLVRTDPEGRKSWPQWSLIGTDTMPQGVAHAIALDVRRTWARLFRVWEGQPSDPDRLGEYLSSLSPEDSRLLNRLLDVMKKLGPYADKPPLPAPCKDASRDQLRDRGLDDRYDGMQSPHLPVLR